MLIGLTKISTDTVPATPMDYEQLEKQVNAIQQDSDILLKTDCDINIKDEIITVKLENDECKLTAKYDENFKVLSISKEDKCMFWVWALVIVLIILALTCVYGYIFITLVIYLLEILVAYILLLFKKVKSILFKKQ